MQPQTSPARKRPSLRHLALGVGLLAAVAVLALRGVNLRGLLEQGMAAIRAAGPGVFFAAMASLPAVGVPVLPFLLTAGPAFGERLGMGLVVALALAALTANFLLTYLLAKHALHAGLEKLLGRLGYRLPAVTQDDAVDLAIILRVTPIPFFVQNYLLGLARVPLASYVVISCLFIWTVAPAYIVFGNALLHGKGRVALLAGSLLVAAAAATHLARKHYRRKQPQALAGMRGR